MPTPSFASLSLFLPVVAFCMGFGVWAVHRTAPADQRTQQATVALVTLLAWLGITSVPTAAGWISPEQPFPGLPITVSLFALFAVITASSRLGARMAATLPWAALIGFQAMRFPLELVLHQWADEGVAPPQMTWTGENIDILAGILSLVAIPFARSRAVAWTVSIVSFGLLLNVGRVVALSMPTPIRTFDEVLMVPFQLPTLWIASICVVSALTMHLITFRALLTDSDTRLS